MIAMILHVIRLRKGRFPKMGQNGVGLRNQREI